MPHYFRCKHSGLPNLLTRKLKTFAIVTMLFVSNAMVPLSAKELVGNVPDFDGERLNEWSQLYVDLLTDLDKFLPDDTITAHVRPFARSIREVTQGISDFHIPLICGDAIKNDLQFDFATETLPPIVFALYTQKGHHLSKQAIINAPYQLTNERINTLTSFTPNHLALLKDITKAFASAEELLAAVSTTFKAQADTTLNTAQRRELLLAAYPYHIEADRIHMGLFQAPPIYPSTSIQSSLRKLVAGRIDGFIFSAVAAEHIIEEEQLGSKLSRNLFDIFNTCFVIAKDVRGTEFDRKFSKAIASYKRSGEYNRLFKSMDDVELRWLEKYATSALKQYNALLMNTAKD